MQLVRAASRSTVGDGRNTFFWEDRWLNGSRVQDLAPSIYARVGKRVRATRTVYQGMEEGTWARDVGPELTTDMLEEYLTLWTETMTVQLDDEVRDTIVWAWESDGNFSTSSAYRAKFWGRQVVPTADFTWKSKAPLRCRFFAWLALQNRCWTSDRLARHGLDHQEACPFCDQEEESINHILLDCVFAKEVWTRVCQAMNKPEWAPTSGLKLAEWCTDKIGGGPRRKDTRAVMILVMWELWKHRNAIVFDGATPSLNHVTHTIGLEGRTWKRAGLLKGELDAYLEALETWATAAS